jgi:hypothetical protein
MISAVNEESCLGGIVPPPRVSRLTTVACVFDWTTFSVAIMLVNLM